MWRRTYQSAQVVPHFRDVRVQANRTGVCIKCVTVLVDLVVQDADGTPEGRVAAISVHGLLIGFVCFGEFLLRHVATSKQVPTLGILIVWEAN